MPMNKNGRPSHGDDDIYTTYDDTPKKSWTPKVFERRCGATALVVADGHKMAKTWCYGDVYILGLAV